MSDELYSNRATGDTRQGNWMQTFSGRQFWPLDPRPEEVFIEDIAHGLSNCCRYAGQCERFYSVAEHSVLCSMVVPAEDALAALLHDAPEAYIHDITRPVKRYLTGYAEIQDEVWACIAQRFGLAFDLPESVKVADNAVLLAEGAQIMKPHPADWSVPGVAADVKVCGHLPEKAKAIFMHRFRELTLARSASI